MKLAIILLGFTFLLGANVMEKVETVPFVDIGRYMGRWYEIASFPQKFQKDCTAVTADYTLKDNGDVKVVNSCRKHSPEGKLKKADAVAWVEDSTTNSKLKVQFFLPSIRLSFFAGNYWIIMLDDINYQYSVVSDPTKKYLWILYRKSVMPQDLLQEILTALTNKGFDTSKLKYMQH